MMEFVLEGLTYGYFLLKHIFWMMYPVWVPGLLVWGLLSWKVYPVCRRWVLEERRHLGTVGAGLVMGLAHTPRRETVLAVAEELRAAGVAPTVLFAYILAAHNVVIYALAFLTLLLGAEFAIGQLIGTLAMVALVAITFRFVFPSEAGGAARHQGGTLSSPAPEELAESGIRGGWGELARILGREARFFVGPLVVGCLVGGFILVGGFQPWWVQGGALLGGGWRADVLNALAAPALAVLAWMGTVTNLPVATGLFKSDALAYPGLVAFLLASVIHPRNIRFYRQTFGPTMTWYLVGALFFAAALSGLLVTGFFALFDFRPSQPPAEIGHILARWLRGLL